MLSFISGTDFSSRCASAKEAHGMWEYATATHRIVLDDMQATAFDQCGIPQYLLGSTSSTDASRPKQG